MDADEDEPAFNTEDDDSDNSGVPIAVVAKAGPSREGLPHGYAMTDSGTFVVHNESEIFEHEEVVDDDTDT